MKLSAVLSLITGLIVTLVFVGYGITEEIPVGSLDGSIVMAENRRPLSTAFITITKLDPFDENEEDIATEHHFKVRPNGKFHLHDLVAGEYKIEISAKAHQLKTQTITINEGKTTTLDLKAQPVDPYLEMHDSQRVYLPAEAVQVQLSGFVPEPRLNVQIYKLNFDKVVKDGGMYTALAPLARPENDKVGDPAKLGVSVQQLTHTLTDKDAEGTFRDRLDLPALQEGLYWVNCSAGKVSRGTWFTITKIALIAKHSNSDLAAYVTSLDTGQPVKGAQVGFATSKGIVAKTTTSDQGLARLSLPNKQSQDDHEVAVALYGGSTALVDFNRAYLGGEEDDSDESAGSETRIYSYTDRPIYRPGDLVQFKGIVRTLVGSAYKMPSAKQVTVQMQDSDGNVLSNQTVALDPLGSYHGQYQFDSDALPDNYSLVTKCGQASDTKDVGVAAYRKPTFSIDVKPLKETYIRGETAQVMVQTKYYYGAPVVGASIKATITRTPYWDWSDYADSEEDYDDEYGEDESPDQAYPGQQLTGGDSGEETQEIDATTDSNGKALISFPTIGANESEEAETDFTYDVSIDAKDQSDKDFTGDATVQVLRSDESIKLSSNSELVEAGKPFTVTAIAKGPNGLLANLPVQVTTGFLEWSHRKELLTDRASQSFSIGPDGKLSLSFSTQGIGMFEVQVSFTDERRHAVVKKLDVFSYNRLSPWEIDDSRIPPGSDLSLTLDKKKYKAGDTVKALITCRDPGGTALLGIEGALLYKVDTVRLSKRTTLYEFKVINDYSPNAFVSVAYIRNKKYHEVSRQMFIDLGVKKLNVSVTSDKPVYHPGDTATYTISTKNSTGKPTPAEVSLGVVDESIYAIFDDQSDIVKGFYPKRSNDIQTDYSFPELYLGGGDKAPTNIQIRRRFKDTAFWDPVVNTDKTGQARVKVKLPDNITSWRATVRAFTADTEVGQATDNLIARKDLMVQLSAPAYVVDGDQERLVAMLTNNTGRDADVRLNLAGQDSTLKGNTNATVHIGNGDMQTVEYTFKPDHSGVADFVAKAWVPNGASDGMELKVPVTPHARLETDGFGGATNSSKTVSLNLSGSADPYSGGLEIDVAPSIAASLLGSIDELVNYPYGCVEQTTSRFLPTVLFGKAFRDLGLSRPKLESEVPKIVRDSYDRLRTMQHEDGGWGWWEYDTTDPYMTAYVLEALAKADEAGYPAPKGVDLDKALGWASSFVANPKLSSDIDKPKADDYRRLQTNTLYLAYSLALHKKDGSARAALAKVKLERCDAAQCAFIALAANTLGDSEKALRDSALTRMISLGHQTQSTLFWDEQDFYGYETSGRCFLALETIRPNDPAVSKLVDYLMQQRKGNMWFSTRDTAAILIAMAEYLRNTKELLSNANITVNLNGRNLKTYAFQQGAFPDKSSVIKLPISALRKGANTLEFRADPGVCYYTTTLKQYVVSNDMPALTPVAGLSVSRAYYKLETQRMEDGTLKLLPSKLPVTDFQSGDIIRCVIKIHTDFPRQYLFIEDPTPSGLHVTDRETPDEGENWTYWWSRTVILDDRVCLFARYVPVGDSEMDYVLQAEIPGACAALPTTIYNMYDPSDTASAGALALTIGG